MTINFPLTVNGEAAHSPREAIALALGATPKCVVNTDTEAQFEASIHVPGKGHYVIYQGDDLTEAIEAANEFAEDPGPWDGADAGTDLTIERVQYGFVIAAGAKTLGGGQSPREAWQTALDEALTHYAKSWSEGTE